MTSKSEVASGEAVKTRKNLGPSPKLRTNSNLAGAATSGDVPLKVATRQKSSPGVASTDSRQRNNLLHSGVKNQTQKKAPVGIALSTGVRNLRAPLLGKLGAADKETLEISKKKTQAQLAREKLATAAAKKLHATSQAQSQANQSRANLLNEKRAVKSSVDRARLNKQQSKPSVKAESPESVVKPGNQLIQLSPKLKSRSSNDEAKQARKTPIINATALLAAKYPNYFADSNDDRTKAESRTVLVISSLILGLIAFGWINWNSINLQNSGEFTYNSGLIGGIAMLLVLLYALRKRMKLMRKAGNMEAWYYFHLLGGVLGPLVIVFHTGFTIKSINSGVALFTMLTIVMSGVFGRYIYTRIGYSLHRKLLAIKESETQLMESLHNYGSPIAEKIERRLSNFSLSVLTGDRNILKLPMRVVAIRGAATACYVKVSTDLASMIKARAKHDGWASADVKARVHREKEQLREHISSIANIANAHLFERILVRWRILHIPLLYILVITALIHVLYVHMY